MSKNIRKSYYDGPYKPKPNELKLYTDIENLIYSKTLLPKNLLKFRPIDNSMRYWISRLGEIVRVSYNPVYNNHIVINNKWTTSSKSANKYILELSERIGEERVVTILNKVKLIANYFVANPESYPFIAFKNIDKPVIESKALCWEMNNRFPELNREYTLSSRNPCAISHRITVQHDDINIIQEENFEGTKTNPRRTPVRHLTIPNDIYKYIDSLNIGINKAIEASLKFMCRFSFSVIAIELEEKGEVFIISVPCMEHLFGDTILSLREHVFWIEANLKEEGYSSFKVSHLSLSKSRSEGFETAHHYMNKYHYAGWSVQNEDFTHKGFKRQISVEISNADKALADAYLSKKHGRKVTTEMYLQRCLDKLVKDTCLDNNSSNS